MKRKSVWKVGDKALRIDRWNQCFSVRVVKVTNVDARTDKERKMISRKLVLELLWKPESENRDLEAEVESLCERVRVEFQSPVKEIRIRSSLDESKVLTILPSTRLAECSGLIRSFLESDEEWLRRVWVEAGGPKIEEVVPREFGWRVVAEGRHYLLGSYVRQRDVESVRQYVSTNRFSFTSNVLIKRWKEAGGPQVDRVEDGFLYPVGGIKTAFGDPVRFHVSAENSVEDFRELVRVFACSFVKYHWKVGGGPEPTEVKVGRDSVGGLICTVALGSGHSVSLTEELRRWDGAGIENAAAIRKDSIAPLRHLIEWRPNADRPVQFEIDALYEAVARALKSADVVEVRCPEYSDFQGRLEFLKTTTEFEIRQRIGSMVRSTSKLIGFYSTDSDQNGQARVYISSDLSRDSKARRVREAATKLVLGLANYTFEARTTDANPSPNVCINFVHDGYRYRTYVWCKGKVDNQT